MPTMPSPNKGFFIDALEPGMEVVGQVAVLRKEMRRKQNGEPYLALELGDRGGRIAANDWDHASDYDAIFTPGAVVKIHARAGEYNGRLQLTILRARPCREEEYQLADFVAASPRDPGGMIEELRAIASGVSDVWLRRLLGLVLDSCASELQRAPAAARIHHPYLGGLLEHILSLCGAAAKLCEHYPRLNRDLLLAGCVLHDIGKLRELDASGVAIHYTVSGRLVGHVAEGLLLVDRLADAIEGFPAETLMLVRHLIVSHHGEPEFGALRQPATPEALALHYLDNLDAKLDHAWRLIDAAPGEQFSAWDPALKREIYRGGA